MREGAFEVSVCDAQSNEPFPEKEIDGMSYIITNPGKEYFIQG